MAIPLHACAVQWGTVTLSEVQSVEVDLTRGLPVSRFTGEAWTLTLGEVRVSTFGVGLAIDSEYGKRRRLTITAPLTIQGGGTVTVFDRDCIYMDHQTQMEANDVLRIAHVFKVMDTWGAPTV